jgi:hypothetical protein
VEDLFCRRLLVLRIKRKESIEMTISLEGFDEITKNYQMKMAEYFSEISRHYLRGSAGRNTEPYYLIACVIVDAVDYFH